MILLYYSEFHKVKNSFRFSSSYNSFPEKHRLLNSMKRVISYDAIHNKSLLLNINTSYDINPNPIDIAIIETPPNQFSYRPFSNLPIYIPLIRDTWRKSRFDYISPRRFSVLVGKFGHKFQFSALNWRRLSRGRAVRSFPAEKPLFRGDFRFDFPNGIDRFAFLTLFARSDLSGSDSVLFFFSESVINTLRFN